MDYHSVVVCNLYWQLLLLLQPEDSPDSEELEEKVCQDVELGKNLFYCVHNLQTKHIQEWVIYMGIYGRV